MGQYFDIEKKNLNNSGSALYQSFFFIRKKMHDVLEEHAGLIAISAYLRRTWVNDILYSLGLFWTDKKIQEYKTEMNYLPSGPWT